MARIVVVSIYLDSGVFQSGWLPRKCRVGVRRGGSDLIRGLHIGIVCWTSSSS